MATFTLNTKNAHAYLNSNVANSVFVYGSQDLATTQGKAGTALQTIYDHGHTLAIELVLANHASIHGFAADATGLAFISIPVGVPLPTLKPDGHGGTLVGHADFVGETAAELKPHLFLLRQ